MQNTCDELQTVWTRKEKKGYTILRQLAYNDVSILATSETILHSGFSISSSLLRKSESIRSRRCRPCQLCHQSKDIKQPQQA
uniref:Uncharacterized protein n=1 Tax=Arundo donax TaxID=35708 RepID=A0A0A8XQ54_ARUDO